MMLPKINPKTFNPLTDGPSRPAFGPASPTLDKDTVQRARPRSTPASMPRPTLDAVMAALDRPASLSVENMVRVAEMLSQLSEAELFSAGPEGVNRLVQQLVQQALLARGPGRDVQRGVALAAVAELLDPREAGADVVRSLSPETKASVERLVGEMDRARSLPDLESQLRNDTQVASQRALDVIYEIPGFDPKAPDTGFEAVFARLVPMAEAAQPQRMVARESAATADNGAPVAGPPRHSSRLVDRALRIVGQLEATRELMMDSLRTGQDLSQESLMVMEAELKNVSSLIAAFQAILEDEHEQRRRAAESIA
ncbi:MAG TPA: hypothetical protein RMG48_15750 [Myxococcales bacterium LLY-WYZ-16_1]|nr:hypothetical protein [Myxococcales bacterium LLY-WYZ-16_1]